jgi:hypothetical protein
VQVFYPLVAKLNNIILITSTIQLLAFYQPMLKRTFHLTLSANLSIEYSSPIYEGMVQGNGQNPSMSRYQLAIRYSNLECDQLWQIQGFCRYRSILKFLRMAYSSTVIQSHLLKTKLYNF